MRLGCVHWHIPFENHFEHVLIECISLFLWFGSMDTVGTFEMTKAFSQHKMVVALHKHYKVDEVVTFLRDNPLLVDSVAVSSGTSDEDYKNLIQVCISRHRKEACVM